MNTNLINQKPLKPFDLGAILFVLLFYQAVNCLIVLFCISTFPNVIECNIDGNYVKIERSVNYLELFVLCIALVLQIANVYVGNYRVVALIEMSLISYLCYLVNITDRVLAANGDRGNPSTYFTTRLLCDPTYSLFQIQCFLMLSCMALRWYMLGKRMEFIHFSYGIRSLLCIIALVCMSALSVAIARSYAIKI